MKNTIIAIFVAFALCTVSRAQDNWPIDVDRLIYAIAEVESGSNDEATGKNGEVGRYQITEKYLSDANRFRYENYPKTDKNIRFRPYTMEDMRDPNKAFEVVLVYLFHYSRCVEGEVTFETLARIHNGGPTGYKNPNTIEYWNKVKKELEKKMEINDFIKLAHDIHEKEKIVAEYSTYIKNKKEEIKKDLEEKELTEYIAGDLAIVLKNVPETMIADTDAMKIAGIFDDYSKPKKGYTSVTIKEIKA